MNTKEDNIECRVALIFPPEWNTMKELNKRAEETRAFQLYPWRPLLYKEPQYPEHEKRKNLLEGIRRKDDNFFLGNIEIIGQHTPSELFEKKFPGRNPKDFCFHIGYSHSDLASSEIWSGISWCFFSSTTPQWTDYFESSLSCGFQTANSTDLNWIYRTAKRVIDNIGGDSRAIGSIYKRWIEKAELERILKMGIEYSSKHLRFSELAEETKKIQSILEGCLEAEKKDKPEQGKIINLITRFLDDCAGLSENKLAKERAEIADLMHDLVGIGIKRGEVLNRLIIEEKLRSVSRYEN